MSDIWIVLIEDSSVDFDALPFSTEERAVEVAREQVLAHAAHPEDINWSPEAGVDADELSFIATYGDVESDCVSVIRRTLDGEP